MILQLDPFKTKSERNSNQVLDVLGDVGGFYQAIDLIIFTFGEFFSAKLFIVSIAAKLYIRKLPKDQSDKEDDNDYNNGHPSPNKNYFEDYALSHNRASSANLKKPPNDKVNLSKMF